MREVRVKGISKGLAILLQDLCYCRSRAGTDNMNHMNSTAFLNKFSARLPAKIREQYTSFKLGRVGQPTSEDLLTFVQRVSIDLKSDPDAGKR